MGEPLALTIAAWLALGSPTACPTKPGVLESHGGQGETESEGGAGTDAGPEDPAPPHPIAGISGLECVSRAVRAGEPDRPCEVRVTSLFPQRTRWMTSWTTEGRTERQIEYRYGSRAFRMPAGTAASAELEGPERDTTMLRMELRSALMLYPDGHPWKGDGEIRTTSIPGMGSLQVRLGSETGGMPVEIAGFDAGGRPVESYREIRWRVAGERSWPASMELWRGDLLVWEESVETVDVKARFLDAYFLPPDRRGMTTRSPVGGEIRDLELPALGIHRAELAPGTSWKLAIRADTELRATWSERLSARRLALDRMVTIEVSDEGRPIACLLRLDSVPDDLPEGFTRVAKRKGLGLAVGGLGEVDREAVERLDRALADRSSRGVPYVRFDPSGGGSVDRVVVVLPISDPK